MKRGEVFVTHNEYSGKTVFFAGKAANRGGSRAR